MLARGDSRALTMQTPLGRAVRLQGRHADAERQIAKAKKKKGERRGGGVADASLVGDSGCGRAAVQLALATTRTRLHRSALQPCPRIW